MRFRLPSIWRQINYIKKTSVALCASSVTLRVIIFRTVTELHREDTELHREGTVQDKFIQLVQRESH